MKILDSSVLATDALGTAGQTVVASCGVSVCRHNVDGRCEAGTIHIAFVEGMAHCATFTPADADAPAGASGVSADMGGANAI